MVIAPRQALDYTSTLRAVGGCIIGWILQMVTLMVFFSIFGRFGILAQSDIFLNMLTAKRIF